MVESGLFLTNHIFLAYTLMYFVLPAYLLKGRYLATGGWVIILFLATAALASLTGIYIVRPLENNFAPKSMDTVHRMSYQTSFYLGLLAGLRGGITIGGLAAAIKLMKHLYIKEQRNLQLVKENAESQLQLLKAQVHPHFLFNTLNNIYSHTQNSSPIAAQLAIGLSEMLRYMLYEGSHLLVPLSRELKMIEEYINLEKIRYGNQLELHIDLPDGGEGLVIAPLLLLPFAENCFKHGTSNFLEHPWLNLQVSLRGNTMFMKLLNGKSAPNENANGKQGIGISNVRKRLELIYPGKHMLAVTDEPDVFIVNLKLELAHV